MKTILLYFFLFVIFSINSLFAQNEAENEMLFPRFEDGIVVFKNGVRSSASLNYNMNLQQMLFIKADSTVLAIANPQEIIVIIIGERRFVPVSSAGVFYEEIPAGKGFFFVNRKANFRSLGKATAYGGYSQTTSTTSYSSWQDNSGNLVKLTPNEKFMLVTECTYYLKSGKSYKRFFSAKTLGKLFKGHESKIQEFANKESINFSNIDDVARIVEYGYGIEL